MITLTVIFLKSLWSKSVGLLGTDKAYPVYVKTRCGIHTFGMKFPIDIIVLNGASKVVKIGENISPNTLFFWSPIHDTVIELPAGDIHKRAIHPGDTLALNIIRVK